MESTKSADQKDKEINPLESGISMNGPTSVESQDPEIEIVIEDEEDNVEYFKTSEFP